MAVHSPSRGQFRATVHWSVTTRPSRAWSVGHRRHRTSQEIRGTLIKMVAQGYGILPYLFLAMMGTSF